MIAIREPTRKLSRNCVSTRSCAERGSEGCYCSFGLLRIGATVRNRTPPLRHRSEINGGVGADASVNVER